MGIRFHSTARGLTSLELLTVMSIVALLAALAVPGFAELRRKAGLSSAANQLLVALYEARSRSILRGVPAALCLSADGASCMTGAGAEASGWLVFLDHERGASVQRDEADELLQAISLPVDVRLSGTRAAVTFWPAARAGTTVTFKLCAVQGGVPGRAVIVSQTGRPRIAEEEVPC